MSAHFNMKCHDVIISPFFGGGSFEFYIQSKYGSSIIANDKFQPLSNFWNVCKRDKATLCTLLRKNREITKEKFREYRSVVMSKMGTEQAMMYFIINRCSFSGATLSGGFSLQASQKRFTASSIDRVESLDLEAFSMSNLDFADFIPSHKTGLMFLDPPYYFARKDKNRLYGKDGDMHEAFDHDKLYSLLKDRKNWMMTYNDCSWVRDKYKDYIVLDEVKWAYGMNKSKKSSELVIVSK